MTDQNIYLATLQGDCEPDPVDWGRASNLLKHELGAFASAAAAKLAITSAVPELTRFSSCDEWVETLDTTIWRVNHPDPHDLAVGWPVDPDTGKPLPVEVVSPDGEVTIDRSPHIWTCRFHTNSINTARVTDEWGDLEIWYDVRGYIYLFTLQHGIAV